ncbi:helix-turn-helix domain-containing protein [Streptomyces sp. 2P-4]|uniref:helix-turn-helix domain-containing protein n=1 Tax=Streptomyces sp. 2P-4 TaxID=2931974 RepID=UPI002540BB82|nr:helix-turn-helix domain-containing protein [Streptomyces sp. 2P-4]
MTDEQKTPVRRGPRGPQERRPRRRGQEREKLRSDLAKGYDSGASIRMLADDYELSFGLTRTLLLEAGVTLRTRARRSGAVEK